MVVQIKIEINDAPAGNIKQFKVHHLSPQCPEVYGNSHCVITVAST